MGAKSIIFVGVCLGGLCLLPGCAGLKRLAPPGIIRYENLAGDQPPSQEIQARIDAQRAKEPQDFPILSAQPDKTPSGLSPEVREEISKTLAGERDSLAAEILNDRDIAAAERERGTLLPGQKSLGERPLEETRDALADAIEKETAAAARERVNPIVPDDQ